MKENNSPWITQLDSLRATRQFDTHDKTDVVIVGGGIAGITTAYFILKNTDRKVVLIESNKVAHGATGHNAGQVVSYFEKQISKIAEEFGEKKAIEAQTDIFSAWTLLDEIMEDTKIDVPFYRFTGYAGLSTFDEIILHIKNNILFKDFPLYEESIFVAEESDSAQNIPEKFKDYYTLMPQKDILDLLETNDTKYIATLTARKGCLNSALFTEKLANYLINKFQTRFQLFENSHVDEVVLYTHGADVKITHSKAVISASRVVLCTNGFEKFTITDNTAKNINTRFHNEVTGFVGYMAGYLEEHNKSPVAISYLGDKDAYFYMTRRPFENHKNEKYNLICVGGPETFFEDSSTYIKEDHVYHEKPISDIDNFIHKTYKDAPKEKIDYQYKWHGLMGYTSNKVRLVGEEPRNINLLYNLGCNGVGILPSIFGARKIADILNNKKFEASVFDPK